MPTSSKLETLNSGIGGPVERSHPHHGSGTHFELSLAALAVMAIVLVQCLTPIATEIYWDMDPRAQPGMPVEPGGVPVDPPITFISAVPLAWMNVVGLVIGAAGLVLHVRAGGKLHRWSSALVALGFIASLFHANEQADDLVRCSAWASASALGLAAFHLAQRPAQRNIFIAGLIALIIPLSIRSIWYVMVEQPQVVQQLKANQEQLLRSHGWESDSSMALQYIRRAEAKDATGVFGLSNVHGSLMSALSLLAIAAGTTLWVAKRRTYIWLPWLLGAGGLMTVALSRSKGAAIAVSLCVVLCLLIPRLVRSKAWFGKLLPFLAAALVFAAFCGVLIRGAMGNPTSEKGERSVLFRYHYWQGTLRMIADSPVRMLTLGAGPTGFQEKYLRFKLPVSPEDVTSNHNVFVDFVVMLGIGGMAWSLLMLYWATLGARASARLWNVLEEPRLPRSSGSDSGDAGQTIPGSSLLIGLGLTLPAFGVNYVYQSPTFLPEVAVMFIASAMAFIVVCAVWVTPGFGLLTNPAAVLGAFLAGLVLLIHNQVEMSFFHLGASPVVWLILALAGGVGASHLESQAASSHGFVSGSAPASRSGQWPPALLLAGLFLGGSVYLANVYAVPVTRQDQHLQLGFRALRSGDRRGAIAALDLAIQDLPVDYRVYRSKAGLLVEDAYAAFEHRDFETVKRDMDEGAAAFEASSRHGLDDSPLIRNKASFMAVRANLLRSKPDLLAAIDLTKEAIARVPYDPSIRPELAKLYAESGQFAEAIAQYREALRLSDQAYLDSLRQFSPRDRVQIEAKIAELLKR